MTASLADGDDDATEQLKQAFLKACGATGSLEAAKAAAALGDEPLASVRAKNGGSALHLAAFAGQLSTAQWLVERGVPVTGVDGGRRRLRAACFAGNLAVCGWLPSSGADIEAADGRRQRGRCASRALRAASRSSTCSCGAARSRCARRAASPRRPRAGPQGVAGWTRGPRGSKRPARAAAAPAPVVKRPRPAPVPAPRAVRHRHRHRSARCGRKCSGSSRRPAARAPPLAAAVAAVPPGPGAAAGRPGAPPRDASRATDDVPVSAKAQNDTAREPRRSGPYGEGRRGAASRCACQFGCSRATGRRKLLG